MRNIKIIIFLALIFSSVSIALAQNNTFKVIGNIKGVKDGVKIYLIKGMLAQAGKLDTVGASTVQDEKFGFTGTVPELTGFYHLRIDGSDKPTKDMLFVNSEMQISGDWNGWPKVELTGSKPQDDYLEVHVLNSAMLQKMKAEKADPVKILNERAQLFKTYIASHPNSLVSPFLILNITNVLEVSEMVELYEQLGADSKSTLFGRQLKEYLTLKQNVAAVKVGELVPDFNVKMADGSMASIRSLAKKNKITLVDFWASWCGPCRLEFPHLKMMYSAYHAKGLGIVGLSQDEKPEAWKKALQEENTPWLHALDVEKAYKETFMLTAIPAYMMLDGDGRIVAVDFLFSSIPSQGDPLRGELLEGTIKKWLR